MPKLSGFEVVELLAGRAPAVVFVTAHDEFAVQAFQIHAVDYILKPVEPARLQQALQRARERLRDPAAEAARSARAAVAARPPGQWLERIVIRDGSHVHVLATHAVDFVEAQDDYLLIAVEPNATASSRPCPSSKGSWIRPGSCASTARSC